MTGTGAQFKPDGNMHYFPIVEINGWYMEGKFYDTEEEAQAEADKFEAAIRTSGIMETSEPVSPRQVRGVLFD